MFSWSISLSYIYIHHTNQTKSNYIIYRETLISVQRNNKNMGLRDIGATLPPGFRFYPSDEELVCHYLYKKICNDHQVLKGTLVEIDLHTCEPWQLPGIHIHVCVWIIILYVLYLLFVDQKIFVCLSLWSFEVIKISRFSCQNLSKLTNLQIYMYACWHIGVFVKLLRTWWISRYEDGLVLIRTTRDVNLVNKIAQLRGVRDKCQFSIFINAWILLLHVLVIFFWISLKRHIIKFHDTRWRKY